LSDVPTATVVQEGKLPGDTPKGAPGGGKRSPYKRSLSNYMLDRSLQLRYILLVTILSGAIAGALGFMIYQQKATSSDSIAGDMATTFADPKFNTYRNAAVEELHAGDRTVIYEMVGVGLGLVVILSAYLLIMTHKVAGPLFKVSAYFDRMAEGRLGTVSALRKGDMLQDFFGKFREMHEAVRTRQQADVITMESAAAALRAKAGGDGQLAEALDAMDRHVTQRKKQLL
jgi:hypothetical protein